MYEVDFLPVEGPDDDPSSKSGDAITIRFIDEASGMVRIVIVDAGFKPVGERVVEHVKYRYGTSEVDLVISTHPDADHLNGLQTVIEELEVQQLLIHLPRNHAPSALLERHYSNLSAIDDLVAAAEDRGTKVTEPFQGMVLFDGQIEILGPTLDLYRAKLEAHIAKDKVKSYVGALAALGLTPAAATHARLVQLGVYPDETLEEGVETSPRNETSVITHLRVDGDDIMLTGDAGLEGLGAAADWRERRLGNFRYYPLSLFQVPHHGSRRNLSPSLLDRIVGHRGGTSSTVAVVSSAAADPKHPSPKVTNALGRRGVKTFATEGANLWFSKDAPTRLGFGPATPIGPAREDDDD